MKQIYSTGDNPNENKINISEHIYTSLLYVNMYIVRRNKVWISILKITSIPDYKYLQSDSHWELWLLKLVY